MTIEDLMTAVDQALKTHVGTIQLNPGELRQVAKYLNDFFTNEANAAEKEPAPAPVPPPDPVPPAA